jgi:NAD(P)-dependent dehydrogenase (short-subunit alcohol dehydrogenase family)
MVDRIADMDLSGRVAIVTGAARGIGAAVAARLAEAGAAVVAADVDATALEASVTALRATGLSVTAAAFDVRHPSATDAMVAVARDTYGGLDILVPNAGVVSGGATHELTDEQWDLVLDVSLRGTFNAVRSASPLLRAAAQHHRKVVIVSSVAGIHGGSTVNYSAAKAGQIGLMRALAREWAPLGVNVNAVAPGRILGTGLGPSTPMPVPIGRQGRPEDVADLVAFLAGPQSDFLTGEVVELHGGLTVMPSAPPPS